jgi:hypothetical protein
VAHKIEDADNRRDSQTCLRQEKGASRSSGKPGEAEIGETRFTSLLAVYERDVALVGAKRIRRCHGRDYREVIAGSRVDPRRDHSSAGRGGAAASEKRTILSVEARGGEGGSGAHAA